MYIYRSNVGENWEQDCRRLAADCASLDEEEGGIAMVMRRLVLMATRVLQ